MKIGKLLGIAMAIAAPAGQASAERLFGLTGANTVVTFDSNSPGAITSAGAIAGLQQGDQLVGLDLRPANRTLYSMATSGNLYSIVKDAAGPGYTAVLIGDTRPGGNLSGNRFGFDFNPVADRLRVLTDFDQNLRINVDTAATIVDGVASGLGAEAYVGAAYTNNRAGATSTLLYALDASGNQLALSSSPNAGTYDDVGTVSGIDFGGLNNVGFDISGRTGTAFFSNGNALYTIDLGTAAATSLGTIGGASLIGLTAAAGVPEPASWAMMIGGFGLMGGALRRHARTLVRFA